MVTGTPPTAAQLSTYLDLIRRGSHERGEVTVSSVRSSTLAFLDRRYSEIGKPLPELARKAGARYGAYLVYGQLERVSRLSSEERSWAHPSENPDTWTRMSHALQEWGLKRSNGVGGRLARWGANLLAGYWSGTSPSETYPRWIEKVGQAIEDQRALLASYINREFVEIAKDLNREHSRGGTLLERVAGRISERPDLIGEFIAGMQDGMARQFGPLNLVAQALSDPDNATPEALEYLTMIEENGLNNQQAEGWRTSIDGTSLKDPVENWNGDQELSSTFEHQIRIRDSRLGRKSAVERVQALIDGDEMLQLVFDGQSAASMENWLGELAADDPLLQRVVDLAGQASTLGRQQARDNLGGR
jgi:hypothetical protein